MLITERLILRPWHINDAEALYENAKNEKIGYNSGFPAHKSVEDSKSIIENVLNKPETYAIVLKESNKVIGSLGIIQYEDSSDITRDDKEVEIGFWIGEDYWGNGYVPEACSEIIKYCFEELKSDVIWCCHFNDNNNSARVKEKLGFKHFRINENHEAKLINRIVDLHVGKMTIEDWKESLA